MVNKTDDMDNNKEIREGRKQNKSNNDQKNEDDGDSLVNERFIDSSCE